MTTSISPSLGHAVWTQGGVGVSPGYDCIDARRSWSVGQTEGALSAGSYKVTQRAAGANMSVDIAASTGDGALVQGDAVTLQGLYTIAPHSSVINEVVTAAHATLPRIDHVVLEVKDNQHDASGSNLAQTRVVAGTPTGGATLDNRTGAAALPSSALLLADVLVAAADTSITDAEIRDYRAYASTGALVGEMRAYGGATAPAGWKLRDGAALKRGVFAALFAVLSTTYGAGDASTTFNLPDLRGRVPVGVDGAAARLTASDALGQSAGAEKHVLLEDELAAHSHPMPHTHTLPTSDGGTGASGTGDGTNRINSFVDGVTGGVSTPNTTVTGSNFAHNNMQPYQVVNWIIFTGSAA